MLRGNEIVSLAIEGPPKRRETFQKTTVPATGSFRGAEGPHGRPGMGGHGRPGMGGPNKYSLM